MTEAIKTRLVSVTHWPYTGLSEDALASELRHLRWYWTLPTITSKVVMAALDALALDVPDHLLPLLNPLPAAVITITGVPARAWRRPRR